MKGFFEKIATILEVAPSDANLGELQSIWLPLMSTIFAILASVLFSHFVIPRLYKGSDHLAHIQQEVIVIAFIVFSNILVIYDTGQFLFEGDTLSTLFASDSANNEQKVTFRRHKKWSTVLNSLTIALPAILIFCYCEDIYCKISGQDMCYKLHHLFLTNEIAALIMFSFFCIADSQYIKAVSIALLVSPAKPELIKLKNLMENALPLIDIVGLLGVIIVTFISFSSLYCIKQAEHVFIEGFALGAIAFHIILTQFNWAYLRSVSLK